MARDRVLVIDDDADFRELVGLVLDARGLRCVEAASCAEALPLLHREQASLRAILLDYFMPGIEPRACAEAILHAVDPEVRVILVSAAVDIGERARELGLARFLAKPFDVAELADAVAGPEGSSDGGAAPQAQRRILK